MFTEIQTITETNFAEILSLQVAKNQEGFIDTIPECLTEAKNEDWLVPLGLYYNNEAVGFAMFGIYEGQVWLDHYLIDERYQGKGLGKHFFEKLLNYFTENYPTSDVYLSVFVANLRAISMYENFEFSFTGKQISNIEKIMKRDAPVQSDSYSHH